MRPALALAVLLPLLAAPRLAAADDLVRLGEDVVVAANAVVDDVLTGGGDATVHGHVRGDLVTVGGDATVGSRVDGDVVTTGGDLVVRGDVRGDVETFGGDVQVDGRIRGDVETHGGRLHLGPHGQIDGDGSRALEHASSGGIGAAFAGFAAKLASYVLLFLLALGLQTLGRERFEALQGAMLRTPGRAGLAGGALLLGGGLACGVLAITVLGLPLAALGALALATTATVGLAASVSIVGAVLPFEGLGRRDAARLAAGTGVLFAASFVPFFGGLALFLATAWGLGALLLTRAGARPTPPGGAGPYRAPARPGASPAEPA